MVPDDVIFMVASVWQFHVLLFFLLLACLGLAPLQRECCTSATLVLFLGNLGFQLTRHSVGNHLRNTELAASDTCPRGRCAGVRDLRSLPLLRSPLLPHVPPERARGRVCQAGLCVAFPRCVPQMCLRGLFVDLFWPIFGLILPSWNLQHSNTRHSLRGGRDKGHMNP